MFLDELYEAFTKYNKIDENNHSKQKQIIEKIHAKNLSIINQTVYIRDLVVRAEKSYCYGESKKHTNQYQQPSEVRIRAQINTLFNLANEDHISRNYNKDTEGGIKLKSGKENFITRLSTHEFSLFTDKPLTIQEYQSLYSDIMTMAEKLEPNVHILLSSFAIKDTEGKLLNMSLFVEGGKPAIIHAFSKNTASLVDVDYDKKKDVFSQQIAGRRVGFHADNITKTGGETISTGTVFELTTQGGARYTQAIDICLDHKLGHSKALINRLIVTEAAPDEIFPEQVEQCVTSNWIDIYSESVISDKILHVDPVRSMHHAYKAPLGDSMLSDEALGRIKDVEFSSMEIKEDSTGYQLINPPFGSNCTVEVLEERPAGKYSVELQGAISIHNKQALQRRVPQSKLTTNTNIELISKISRGETIETSRTQIIREHLNQMEKELLKNCRCGFLQKLFNINEYRQKKEAEEIIKNSFDVVRKSIDQNKDASILMLPAWKKDLELRLDSLFITPNQLKIGIKKNLENILNNEIQILIGFNPPSDQTKIKAQLVALKEEQKPLSKFEDIDLGPPPKLK